MSLLEDLRAAAPTVDAQFLPTANELVGVVGGLALYLEHGDDFLQAAEQGGVTAVTDLIASGKPAAEPVDAEQSDKDAAQAARRATSQQTTVEHEPGESTEKSAAGKGKGKG